MPYFKFLTLKNNLLRLIYAMKKYCPLKILIFSGFMMKGILMQRPKKIVIIYGSRFGHLLSNTEYYLQHEKSLGNNIESCHYVNLSDTLDSLELLGLIQDAYGIVVKNGMEAQGLYWAGKALGSKITDIRPQSEPISLPFISGCASYIKQDLIGRPHVTISLRNGQYSSKIQGATEPTNWRDTPAKSLQPSIEKILDYGFDIYLINKCLDSRELISYGVKDMSAESLRVRWSLISSAKFHIGTCTGIDSCAIFSRIPICQINGFFGPSLNSPIFTGGYVGYMLPMQLMYSPDARWCNYLEKIELIRRIEVEHRESSVIHPMLSKEGYLYIPNSGQMVLDAISELMTYVDKRGDSSKEQKLFWSNYPNQWVNVRNPEVVFHSSLHDTGLRISQKYLLTHGI